MQTYFMSNLVIFIINQLRTATANIHQKPLTHINISGGTYKIIFSFLVSRYNHDINTSALDYFRHHLLAVFAIS